MTLELARLTSDLDTMSATLAQLDQARRTQLDIARERLRIYAHALDEIDARVQITQQKNLHWRGSYPAGDEPLDAHHLYPDMPSRANIIANDGSQVPIDRHAAALYYALNIGYIVYPYGTTGPPVVGTQPSVHYNDHELFDDNRLLIPNTVVNARRTIREMRNLAELAEEYIHNEPPVAVLADGPLVWFAPGDTPHERRDRLKDYLASLERLKAASVTLGGYVDRPGSTGVLNLLHLASLDTVEITKDGLACNDLAGLIDARLFEALLKPGERSALFVRQSPTNRDYNDAGHEIWHFYVNVSADPVRPLVSRVEMPSWVAGHPARLDLLHAVVWQQCQVMGRYPYVLARAHELALISTDERRDLDEMVIGALRRRGLDPRSSEKAWQKALTGGAKRRHRL